MTSPGIAKRQSQFEPEECHQRVDPSSVITRRRFLQGMGTAMAGLLAAGCLPKGPVEGRGPKSTLVPTVPATTPTTLPTPPSLSQVAIAQVESYDRTLVRQGVQALLDGLGGLDDLISSGDRVIIKVNLVGGSTNRLEEIEVVGASIDDVRCEFQPNQEM